MPRVSEAELLRERQEVAEASYENLDGRWRDYVEVAKRFEHKALAQDRLDLRHTIILEFAKAEKRTGKTLAQPQMYRIASYMVAEYWRKLFLPKNSLPCGKCSKQKRQKCLKYNSYQTCQKAVTIASLDAEVDDGEGNKVTLADTIVDDKAVDLSAWVDARTFLLGCPKRLLLIAVKRVNGKPLTVAERVYLAKWRRREQAKLL